MPRKNRAPDGHENSVSLARPEAIHDPPGKDIRKPIREGKARDHVAVAGFGPVQVLLQQGSENAEDLAVHIVGSRRKKKQRTDKPAHTSSAVLWFTQDFQFGLLCLTHFMLS